MKWFKTNKSSRQKLQYQSCIAAASSFVRFIHLVWYTTWQSVQHIVILKDCTFFLHVPHSSCSALLLCIDKPEQKRYIDTCNIVIGFRKNTDIVISVLSVESPWKRPGYSIITSFQYSMPSSLLKMFNGNIQLCNVLYRCGQNYVRGWTGGFNPQGSHRHNSELGLLEFYSPMVE